MANKLALSLVIGGAVASSLGSAFKTVESGISKLEQKGKQARVLKSTIGETIKLRDEWKKAHDSGSASAAGLLRKLEGNLDALRKQGVQVGRLDREYQRLGKTARAMDLQVKGRQQIEAGTQGLKSTAAMGTAAVAAVTIPTVISANYQDKVRDIAIKAGVANQPEEQAMSKRIIQVAQDNGMSRDGVADIVNQMVGAGMDLDRAMSYADVAAKFAVGQGSSGEDTARMIMSLEQNAKITDPEAMKKTLEGIALQGQAGSFEASDMARWFPVLLAGMEKTGSVGPEAVAQLGAMLQVQMKTAGGSDEAANNLKNWIEKIGSGEVVDAYKKAGIDYQASLTTGIQKGMSVMESSLALAMQYVQKTDPAKAKKMAEAQAKIDKEVDPAKALKMLEALEQSLKTGDIFADMQVKAALTAYSQNRGFYEKLKADAKDATGILDKNLTERRETSKQRWAETANAIDDAMRSAGDAIRPMTDWAALNITKLAQAFTSLSDGSQSVVAGVVAVGAGLIGLKGIISSLKLAKGLTDLATGKTLERLADRVAAPGSAYEATSPVRKQPGTDAKPGLLDRFRRSANDSAPEPVVKGPDVQRVFVVNTDSLGRSMPGAANDPPSKRKRPRRKTPGRPSATQPGVPKAKRPVPVVPKAAELPALKPGMLGRLGEVAKEARMVTKVGRRLPGGSLVDAGVGALEVALTAETRDEKAEGYGGVAGGLAGSLAGAAVGATIGSVVPVIGTAIGGLVGAVLGGMGGEAGGSWLGKSLFGEKKPEEVAQPASPAQAPPLLMASAPVAAYAPPGSSAMTPYAVPALTANQVSFPGADLARPQVSAMGDVVRDLAKSTPPSPSAPELAKAAAPKSEAPKVEQSFTFAPNIPVNVQGDVKDPARLAQEIWPHIQRQMDDFARQQQARQLSDEPHV